MATTRLNLAPLPGACGKMRLDSRREADRAIRDLQVRDSVAGKPVIPMRIYWCSACQAIHVSRRSRGGQPA
jgi:hypothetical protein